MKRILMYLMAITGILVSGCNEEDDGSHVAPITLYEKLNGNWALMSLKMTDEVAKANVLEPFEQNLSTVFNYPDFMLTLNVDDALRPTSYQVTGSVPPLFPLSGYWELSSDFQQTSGAGTMIYLYSDAQKTQKTDELRLISVPGSSGEMEFQLTRRSGGSPFVSYNFKLNTLD
jgi:hypothetical protein